MTKLFSDLYLVKFWIFQSSKWFSPCVNENSCPTGIYLWYLLHGYKRMHSALRVLDLGHRYSLEKSGSFSSSWCNANLCGRRHFIIVACGLPRDYLSRNSLRSHLDKSELARSLCVTTTICLPLNGCKHEQLWYTYVRSTITFIYRIYDPNVRLYVFPEKI